MAFNKQVLTAKPALTFYAVIGFGFASLLAAAFGYSALYCAGAKPLAKSLFQIEEVAFCNGELEQPVVQN